MDSKELRGLMEAYAEMYAPQEEIEEGYKEPRLDRKAFVKHANKRSGFSLGTREDPHGWREPGMEKVAKEFAARTASSRKAKRTGQTDAYKAEKEAQSKLKKEHFEIFDTVLEFLQVEGYAETLEEAEWLMANVIDEEAIDIILDEGKSSRPRYPGGRGVLGQERRDEKREASAENMRGHTEGPGTVTKNPKKLRKQKAMGELGEAQEARNNPEKYEREQSKKYAPVRGERTPMPPRGNKRREDFEKWYAANVR